MAVSVVPWPVIRMMGRRGLAACSSRISSSPPRPGNLMSVMTTSARPVARAGQAGVAAGFDEDFVAFFRQHPAQAHDDARIILDQQDFGGVAHCAIGDTRRGGKVK